MLFELTEEQKLIKDIFHIKLSKESVQDVRIFKKKDYVRELWEGYYSFRPTFN